jgi:hypothetical protein
VYVLAPTAEIVVDAPLQIAAAPGVAVIVGIGFTVMIWVVVFAQPAALVPVIV